MQQAKNITNTIASDALLRVTIFKVLVGSLICLSLAYVYFIGSITFNVLARKTLEITIREVGSNVGELELSYLNIESSIDENFAKAHGFVDARGALFATRGTSSVALR
jgi:hypothetical protein